MLTIDADHGLTADAKKAQWETEGLATARLTAPELTMTVASEHDQCDIDGYHSDIRNDYFCVEYGEEIDRQIRIYVPDEYWTPYVRTAVEPVSGGVEASFAPAENGQYTAVTFTATEPGTYAWAINREASWFSGAKDRTLKNLENVTGVGVPSTSEWQYIAPEKLSGTESAFVVRAPNGTDNLILEYRTGPEEWTTVPDEEREFAPVYYQTKDGVDDRVFVFATNASAPEVRYKTKAGSRDRLGSALREIGQIPTRLEEILNIDIPFL